MAKNGIFKKISRSINSAYTQMLRIGGRIMYRRQFANLLSKHPHKSFEKENEYKDKWKRLDKRPDISTYRLFAQYIGETPDIAPEDIVSGYIQPLLNPIEFRTYYQDKNMFEKILPKSYLPISLLRGIRGCIYDEDFQLIDNLVKCLEIINNNETVVFLKPSVDSSSGEGVIGFCQNEDGKLHSLDNGSVLDNKYIESYIRNNPDFILQRGLSQHAYLRQFNPSSINTIRIATYRSVKDGRAHALNAIIRIGKNGSFIDNAHAGGLFVGIDHDGKLGKYACDQYGNKFNTFNGINFKDNEYVIPNFQEVKHFVEEIASNIFHARLIAHDVCIQADGSLKLVEFNIRAFSAWLFQFTSGTAFEKWTDEIIEYCSVHKKDIQKVFAEPF